MQRDAHVLRGGAWAPGIRVQAKGLPAQEVAKVERLLGLMAERLAVAPELGREGKVSFQDLLPAPSASQPAKPAEEAGGGGLGLDVGRLAVTEARLSFSDGTRKPAFSSTLGPLTFALEKFRTRGGKDSPFSFDATTESGERLTWDGTLLSAPLRSAGRLALKDLKLSKYQPSTTGDTALEIRDGRLSLEARYQVEWSAARHEARVVEAHAEVTGLALARGGDRERR